MINDDRPDILDRVAVRYSTGEIVEYLRADTRGNGIVPFVLGFLLGALATLVAALALG